VVCTLIYPDRIIVDWTDNSDFETEFVVEASVDGAPFVPMSITSSMDTSNMGGSYGVEFGNLKPSTGYRWRVIARDPTVPISSPPSIESAECRTAGEPQIPSTPSPRPTWTAVPTRTPKPYAPETPVHPECVCEVVYDQVPSVIISDALANPEHFYGWRYPLDQGKPVSPGNPLRECLSLMNISMPYHPTWNKPVWRVGCP
jgi:hypothetical protein